MAIMDESTLYLGTVLVEVDDLCDALDALDRLAPQSVQAMDWAHAIFNSTCANYSCSG
jgi:hypothetical protein